MCRKIPGNVFKKYELKLKTIHISSRGREPVRLRFDFLKNNLEYFRCKSHFSQKIRLNLFCDMSEE